MQVFKTVQVHVQMRHLGAAPLCWCPSSAPHPKDLVVYVFSVITGMALPGLCTQGCPRLGWTASCTCQHLPACLSRLHSLSMLTECTLTPSIHACQVLIMALIAATVWLRTQTHPISVPDASK